MSLVSSELSTHTEYTTLTSVSTGVHTDTLVCMSGTLGQYIQKRREALGINQTELARRAGLERTTVNRIETGSTKLPSAAVRRSLAEALGVRHIDILIASGEITEDEIELPPDTRSDFARRIQPIVDQLGEDDDGLLLVLEGVIRGHVQTLLQYKSGALQGLKATWEEDES